MSRQTFAPTSAVQFSKPKTSVPNVYRQEHPHSTLERGMNCNSHTFAWVGAGFLAACFAFLASLAALWKWREINQTWQVGKGQIPPPCEIILTVTNVTNLNYAGVGHDFRVFVNKMYAVLFIGDMKLLETNMTPPRKQLCSPLSCGCD